MKDWTIQPQNFPPGYWGTTVAYRPNLIYAAPPGMAGCWPMPQPEPVKRIKNCLYCRSGYDYEIQRCPNCGAPEHE